MKARKTFIEHTKNQGDKYAIGWRWTTNIIDFREYDKFNMNMANRYVGIPDDEEHKWKNGWYSCEYNESLNWLLSVGLVEIIYDELEDKKMSKSIYDEAKEELQGYIGEYGMDYYETNHFPKTSKAIERAKKVEELLELYKEINSKRKELITLSRYNTWSWKLDIEIKEIQDKIKELEKEK